MDRHFRRLDELHGLGTGNDFAAFRRHFIGMRDDYTGRLYQTVHDICRLRWPGREDITDIHHGEFRAVMPTDNTILFRRDTPIARKLDDQSVSEFQHIARRRARVPGKPRLFQHLTEIAADKRQINAVRMDGQYRRDHHAAELAGRAEPSELRLLHVTAE